MGFLVMREGVVNIIMRFCGCCGLEVSAKVRS